MNTKENLLAANRRQTESAQAEDNSDELDIIELEKVQGGVSRCPGDSKVKYQPGIAFANVPFYSVLPDHKVCCR